MAQRTKSGCIYLAQEVVNEFSMPKYPPVDIQKEIVRTIAEDLGIRVYFRRMKYLSGAFYAPNTITISTCPYEVKHTLETFFHELGHWYCYHNFIFKAFHRPWLLTRRSIREMIRTATRAELWVDKWGERQCKQYFPEIVWKGAYRDHKTRREMVEDLKKEYGVK